MIITFVGYPEDVERVVAVCEGMGTSASELRLVNGNGADQCTNLVPVGVDELLKEIEGRIAAGETLSLTIFVNGAPPADLARLLNKLAREYCHAVEYQCFELRWGKTTENGQRKVVAELC